MFKKWIYLNPHPFHVPFMCKQAHILHTVYMTVTELHLIDFLILILIKIGST